MEIPMHADVISGSSAESIYRSARQLIQEGRLPPGMALPPVRNLAAELSVNRNTVGAAYKRLALDGYVHAEGRRGTIVASAGRAAPAVPASPPGIRNLSDGNPDPALLPDLRKVLADAASRPFLYGEFVHLSQLVETAPSFFRRPGVTAEQMAIVGGAMDGLERILTTCLKPGDRVIVEDPCFASALDLVRALGLVPVPVDVDQHGMLPSGVEAALQRGVQAIIMTPIAHNPTGAVMTPERFDRLKSGLRKHPDVLVIEDDYFSLLCVEPLPPNRDTYTNRWVTICSVSKIFGPDLRLGVLFGNPAILNAVKARQKLGSRWVSHVLQGAVLNLMLDPKIKASLVRAGRIYAERRILMQDQLQKIGFAPTSGIGLNIWVPLAGAQNVAHTLSSQGLVVRPGDSFTLNAAPGIRISTGRIDSAIAIEFGNALQACIAYPERSLGA
jgi:DNA-binding transcriptional MocR family regulator